MSWSIRISSPQLGQFEREVPSYALLSGVMDLMFQTMKVVRQAGVAVELTLSLEPLTSRGTGPTEGGATG